MADLGGPMAHQLPYHSSGNHRGELVQPSLVMNHHHSNSSCHGGERDVHGNFISKISFLSDACVNLGQCVET